MEIKTEADNNDITECQHDDGPSVGMFDLLIVVVVSYGSSLHCFLLLFIRKHGDSDYNCC